jgi:hypothetical protein
VEVEEDSDFVQVNLDFEPEYHPESKVHLVEVEVEDLQDVILKDVEVLVEEVEVEIQDEMN